MYDYRAILKRAGIVLIAAGIPDIAYGVYYVSQGRNYSSSLNVLLPVAGIVLALRGLRVVPAVTRFVALVLSNLISLSLLLPFLKPAGLWTTEFRLDPIGISLSLLIRFISIALIFWVYRRLRSRMVVSASAKSSHATADLKLAFIIGIAIAVLPVGILYLTRVSAAGAKAVEIARAQYGETYSYHLTGMSQSNGYTKASLTAYNEREIKPIRVEWER